MIDCYVCKQSISLHTHLELQECLEQISRYQIEQEKLIKGLMTLDE